MTLTRKTQIGLVLTTLVLFVLLFLAPKTHSSKKLEDSKLPMNKESQANVEAFLTIATKSLKNDLKTEYDGLIKNANASSIDTSFMSVVQFWDKQKKTRFCFLLF